MTKIKNTATSSRVQRAAAAARPKKGNAIQKSAKSPTRSAAANRTSAKSSVAKKTKATPKSAVKTSSTKAKGPAKAKNPAKQTGLKKGAKSLNVKASSTQKATPSTKKAKILGKQTTPKNVSAKKATGKKAIAKKASTKKVAAKKSVAKKARSKKVAAKKPASVSAKKALKKTTSAKSASAKKSDSKIKTVKSSTGKKKVVREKAPEKSSVSQMAAAMFSEEELAGEEEVLMREAANDEKKRDLLERLAVSSDRYDDLPNQELASQIVFHLDEEAVSILVSVIEGHDDVHAPDAARVVFEVGSRDEELLLPMLNRLIALCCEEHYEMLAFSMYALAPLGKYAAESLWEMRELFWQAITDADTHMQMTQVGAVKLLSCLCAAGPDNARTLAGGLVDLLGKCPPNDVAMFAESVLPALGTAHSHRAKPVLDRRMKELTPAEVARLRRAVRQAQSTSSYSYAA
ncbi:MAG: hypothetical protein GY822_25560 [Deltaproteobacteria bacterium]|nr:hypothetical protein [Deltaproteobacteria bacterium]